MVDKLNPAFTLTQVKDDDNRELTELLDYMANTKADSNKFGALSDTVSYYKNQGKGVDSMCKIIEEYGDEQRRKGVLEGEIKGKIEGKIEGKRETKLEVVEMMINDGFTLEKALRYAKLDRQTYEKYLKEQ